MTRIALLFLAILPFSLSAKDRTVPVFILAGQSNMEGHGRISGSQKGTLETLSNDPATADRYRHLRRCRRRLLLLLPTSQPWWRPPP